MLVTWLVAAAAAVVMQCSVQLPQQPLHSAELHMDNIHINTGQCSVKYTTGGIRNNVIHSTTKYMQ